jgi:hypothetical protein
MRTKNKTDNRDSRKQPQPNPVTGFAERGIDGGLKIRKEY